MIINIYMGFNFGTGPIGRKLREDMYLRHLRYVEQISNRQAEVLKDDLNQYHSINQRHGLSKLHANHFKRSEQKNQIAKKNLKIYRKIMSIQSTEQIRHNSHTKKRYFQNSEEKPIDLHHFYRKKQQERINLENKRLKKAIKYQKSALLPEIKYKNNMSSSLQKSSKFLNLTEMI